MAPRDGNTLAHDFYSLEALSEALALAGHVQDLIDSALKATLALDEIYRLEAVGALGPHAEDKDLYTARKALLKALEKVEASMQLRWAAEAAEVYIDSLEVLRTRVWDRFEPEGGAQAA
jgi:hypothetical protein